MLPTWFLLACRPEPAMPGPAAEPTPAGPPQARWDMVASLVDDLQARRHPSDGGGRAWVAEGGPGRVSAPGRWVLVYEAGEHGIREGGFLFFQSSPFWGWSTPQADAPGAPGYTRVSTSAAGVTLRPETVAANMMAIAVEGRDLRPGERVTVVFGDGDGGAVADRYRERCSPFWFAVDGDGDGVRGVVEDSPCVAVEAGSPVGVVATLPSTGRLGEPVDLVVASLDSAGNAGTSARAELDLVGPGLELPASLAFAPGDGGHARVRVTPRQEGVLTVRVELDGRLLAESNPLLVSETAPRVLWGDVHGHSALSDGTGSPADYYAYARDVAALDFAALTDHDHWGMLFVDAHPELLREIREATDAAYAPGSFVTLHGYEWTSWVYGHRHVLWFGEPGTVWSSLDEATDTPQELWEHLRGQEAMTLAHHSAGGPIGTDWSIPPDPVLEPLTEVTSVHGQSESLDGPGVIYSPVKGNFVRDALDLGYELGFVGSGDGHDGHPGLAHLASGQGGVAAAIGAEPTREGLMETMRARRVYATNGPRILLLATLDGQPMGSTVGPGHHALQVFTVGTAPIAGVDVVRSGRVERSVEGGAYQQSVSAAWDDLAAGEYLYVRVRQVDGGTAWSSPFFVR